MVEDVILTALAQAATPNEEERKSKRERKQTQFYDVTADGSSPAKKPETPGKGGGGEGTKVKTPFRSVSLTTPLVVDCVTGGKVRLALRMA